MSKRKSRENAQERSLAEVAAQKNKQDVARAKLIEQKSTREQAMETQVEGVLLATKKAQEDIEAALELVTSKGVTPSGVEVGPRANEINQQFKEIARSLSQYANQLIELYWTVKQFYIDYGQDASVKVRTTLLDLVKQFDPKDLDGLHNRGPNPEMPRAEYEPSTAFHALIKAAATLHNTVNSIKYLFKI